MKLAVLSVVLALTWQSSLSAWHPNCGQSKYSDVGGGIPPPDRMIVGGVEARPNEFPWMVSYRYAAGGHRCGAVIITPRWVLTAAHCTEGMEGQGTYVTVGAQTRSGTPLPSQRDYELEEIIMHEEYGGNNRHSADIALLRTVEPIVFNEDVQPACAPSNPSDQNAGDLALVSGWGAIFSGGPSSETLLYTTVYVTEQEECRLAYQTILEPGMICTGALGGNDRDSCQGDSGGPLVIQKNGVAEVVGLTSFGRGCAGSDPGVYARVGYYYDWVTQRVGGAL